MGGEMPEGKRKDPGGCFILGGGMRGGIANVIDRLRQHRLSLDSNIRNYNFPGGKCPGMLGMSRQLMEDDGGRS
jgi:hypothetical protein